MPTLSWLGDSTARRASRKVPYRILEPVETVGDPASDNLLIQGDSLEALKALLPFYAGRVKCIYIDPPFNTEQAFEHYDDNLEHSQWLSMMYPRLELLRELLDDTGTLALHIDDNELGYLIAVCDELIGRKNRLFIATFKQSSASGPKAINPGLVSIASYVICYAKNKNSWKHNRIFVASGRDSRYGRFILNRDDDCSAWRFTTVRKAFCNERQVPEKQIRKMFGDSLEAELTQFVLANHASVARTARVAEKDIGDAARDALRLSTERRDVAFKAERPGQEPQYFLNGEQLIFYTSKTRLIDGVLTTGQPLTSIWDDLLSNNLHNEGGVSFENGKKPEGLIRRILELASNAGDLVLDSFLGSGTTAAVAHKMGRRWIGIEMGDHAVTHCVPRLKKVIDGEQGGISEAVGWKGGGGFRFLKLGAKAFFDDGALNADIKFKDLAAYLWFIEARMPHSTGVFTKPLLGMHGSTTLVLLYNGIIADRRPESGNVLTTALWNDLRKTLPRDRHETVIYGEACRLSAARMKDLKVTFKQIPYDIGIR